ncbi:uncharacterized protein LOC109721589 [Ananas comosus]|uniref:Uncharacterized protein LOC109721589 n=1 Tax=Ananas comosus TaxID=4615 RepID=A0A6P5GAL5_ANACO|nr:uncharacterized protein LOC109721589 [Ananas comosus]
MTPSSYGLLLVPLFLLAYVSANSSAARLFACVSFLTLLLLRICIHLHEAAPHGSPRRRSIRAAVWSLSTLLTAMFSYRVAETLPLPMVVVVWCTGAATLRRRSRQLWINAAWIIFHERGTKYTQITVHFPSA